MTTFIADLLNNNLFEKCVNESFLSLNCILGSSSFGISIIILSLNFFGFYKLYKFFHKLNFETSLILLNIIQIIIIQLLIITCYSILIECFNLVQIGMLTWIIRKFNILLKNPLKFFRKNKLFGFLNIINISLFIYYIALVDPQNSNGTNYPIILFHTGFSFLCSFILGIYSYSLLGKIKKIINEEKESPKIAFEPSEEVNDALLIKKDNEESDNIKDFIFYSKREMQIKPLFKINLFCTFIEFSFTLSVYFLPSLTFQNVNFKIIPDSIMSHVFYYLFILICIINTFINFFCFYWRIKSQYEANSMRRNMIITNKFLKREKMEIDNNKNNNEIKEKNIEGKAEKSIFDISFEESFIDNPNNGNNNFINELDKSKDIFDEEMLGKIHKEKNEFLNNENEDRESISLDFYSENEINRVSKNNNSFDNIDI